MICRQKKSIELYITNNVKGFLINENHRYAVKEWVRTNNPDLFSKEPHWKITLTHIFIGLSPDQARFLANVQIRCLQKSGYVNIHHQLPTIGQGFFI